MSEETYQIRVTSKQDGFRRCGVEHTGSQIYTIPDDFTPDEVEILKNEPMLVVDNYHGEPDESGSIFAETLARHVVGELEGSNPSHEDIDEFAGTFTGVCPQFLEFIGKDHNDDWPKSKKLEVIQAAIGGR